MFVGLSPPLTIYIEVINTINGRYKSIFIEVIYQIYIYKSIP